jgi:peptide/nickel transport system ATP-binding protein
VKDSDAVLKETMAHLLEVCGLTVGIKKNANILKAVNDISFSVDEGEILGLAGESGCGKTLTALSIVKLLPQAAQIMQGGIIYDNKNLTSLDEGEMRRLRGSEISVIFQETRQSLNPLIKAGRQITENLEFAGTGKIKKLQKERNKTLALEMLASLGFDKPEKIFDAYPHQLSGGMCQRVMTAVAVIRHPKLLIGDELSSSLDKESHERCLSVLMEMNRKYKMSLLIISHDLSIIRRFCSRFLIMYAGKIVEEGPAQALFSPLHPYTSALLSAIPGREKRGNYLENISGKVPSIDDRLTGCPFAPRCRKAQSICFKTFPPDYFSGVNELDAGQKQGKRKVYCYFPHTGVSGE